jgi:hypothetical protein
LHYVFDLWAIRWRNRRAEGNVIIVRYADGIVVGFAKAYDAKRAATTSPQTSHIATRMFFAVRLPSVKETSRCTKVVLTSFSQREQIALLLSPS